MRILIAMASVPASAAVNERLYRRYLRGWVLTWGATDEEAARPLPGDDLLDAADIVSTRAIGIGAPPSAIGPWLVQMGPGRAGAYTYDWIENLFGLNMHSADRIQAEWQNLEVGDVLRSREDRPGMRVEILDPERVLSNRSEAGDWVWTFVLVPEDRCDPSDQSQPNRDEGRGGRPAPGDASDGTDPVREGGERPLGPRSSSIQRDANEGLISGSGRDGVTGSPPAAND